MNGPISSRTSEDLAKAEALERATFEVPRKPEQKAFDTHALKSLLGFHAEVLTALGKKRTRISCATRRRSCNGNMASFEGPAILFSIVVGSP